MVEMDGARGRGDAVVGADALDLNRMRENAGEDGDKGIAVVGHDGVL
jgi:hypothetical protein